MSLMQKKAGFAIVEVMVTVAIITIGISGMGILLIRAIQGTQDSAQQSQAMWIVQDYVGRMRANPDGAKTNMYVLNPASIDCNTPPMLCAETYQDGAEVAATACQAQQMATFDNWITTCGLNATIYDSASDFIMEPKLTSQCVRRSNLDFCIQYQVNLKWDTKIAKGSSNEDERINENNYSMIVEFN